VRLVDFPEVEYLLNRDGIERDLGQAIAGGPFE
jgi:hypothetical protein